MVDWKKEESLFNKNKLYQQGNDRLNIISTLDKMTGLDSSPYLKKENKLKMSTFYGSLNSNYISA